MAVCPLGPLQGILTSLSGLVVTLVSDPVQFSIYPLELVRTRLAVCPMGTYRGIWDCWRQIVRKEGWACFYRGLTPSLVGCYFASTLSESCLSAGAPVPAGADFFAEELTLQIVYEDKAPHVGNCRSWQYATRAVRIQCFSWLIVITF